MTNKKLITKGIIKAVITIISAFGASLILNYLNIQLLQLIGSAGIPLGAYSKWVFRWGVVIAGFTFLKESATKDSWRYALGDFLIPVFSLFFMFKMLSLDITVSQMGVTVTVSIIGFFYVSLIATMITIIGKALKILEGIGK